jgi:late competence protein required for DNA uptake (superfamily II DNA/RNA helicase)
VKIVRRKLSIGMILKRGKKMRCNWCGKGSGRNYTKDKEMNLYYYYCEDCCITQVIGREMVGIMKRLIFYNEMDFEFLTLDQIKQSKEVIKKAKELVKE